jgi:hypothetical protein
LILVAKSALNPAVKPHGAGIGVGQSHSPLSARNGAQPGLAQPDSEVIIAPVGAVYRSVNRESRLPIHVRREVRYKRVISAVDDDATCDFVPSFDQL